MIDPIVTLAFSVYSNKGVYALLIGSGVSRGAGIPTGWEIVEDLVRKYSAVVKEECGDDWEGWYLDKTGKEPNYSELIKAIGKKQSERQALLRSYFEPNEEEREQGIKVPTLAHRAIAELVSEGFIKVIITTNFDKLIEKALDEKGINPIVLSTEDAIKGAPPLPHNDVVLLKVNGDYTDIRIRNTPEELQKYPKEIEKLLDRIFDEYGLIVCGWSAEWDIALRKTMEKCKSRRFTTYWTIRREPEENAKKIIQLRSAEAIHIKDANSFFEDLTAKTDALEVFEKPHPLSSKIAVITLKKNLEHERSVIRTHDLVMGETERIYEELFLNNRFPTSGVHGSQEELNQELSNRVKSYEAITETIRALFAHGCHWGYETHETIWAKSLERLGNPPRPKSWQDVWLELQKYPALIISYTGGISALYANKYDTFKTLVTKPIIRDLNNEEPFLLAINSFSVLRHDRAQLLPGMERHHTPVSDQLQNTLRETLYEIIPDENIYIKYFDKFEYLLALVYFSMSGRGRAPIGCFIWRDTAFGTEPRRVVEELEQEAKEYGADWPLLQIGLFKGDLSIFFEIKNAFDEYLKKIPLH